MALIIDPDLLTDSALDDGSTELYIDPVAKTFKLNPGVGNLDAVDGGTLQAVYSKYKIDFKADPHSKNFSAYPDAFEGITDEFFELINGWTWADSTTEETIRNSGWLVRDTSGNVTEHWAGLKAIGDVQPTDQLYFDLGQGAVDLTFQGAANQAVQVISDPNGDGNYADGYDRSAGITIYNRTQGRTYGLATLVDIGESSLLAPKVFSFAVGNSNDTDIAVADVGIDANSDGTADVAPYSGMSITWYGTPQQRNIGGTNYDFGVVIDGNSGTIAQIYEFVQWSLRQDIDIDAGAGTQNGRVAENLLELQLGQLTTLQQSNGDGVFIDNYQVADQNNITFTDDTGTERAFPSVAVLTLLFNDIIQAAADAEYWVYFSDAGGNQWGTTNAIVVEDNSAADMQGIVSAQASIQHDFAYDTNAQGGRTAGTDAAITVIVAGLGGTKIIKATSTITNSTTNTVQLVGQTERQFLDPA